MATKAERKERLRKIRQKYHLGEYSKKTKTRRVFHMARKHKKHSFKKGFSFEKAIKVVLGAGVAAAYEIFISPMIPLAATIKNALEFVLGLVLMFMPGMPMVVRATGAALATINAYALLYPVIANFFKKGSM